MVHSKFLILAIVISFLCQFSTKITSTNNNSGMKKNLQKLDIFLEEEPSSEKNSTSGNEESSSKEEQEPKETSGETNLVNIKCLWVNKYNVYSLQKLQNKENDYENDVTEGKIIFNFCQNTKTKINGTDSQSTVLWNKNDSLIRIAGSIDGDSDTKNKWSEQEDESGNYLMISFAKGEKCSNSSYHKTFIKIYCSDEKDFFKDIKFSGFDENSCTHTISSHSVYGCALTDIYLLKKILHEYWYIFGIGLIIIGVYLCFYGHKVVWLTAIIVSGLIFCFIISIIFLNLLPSLITTETSLWILLGVTFAFGALVGCFIKAKVKLIVALIGAGMGYCVALLAYQIIQSFIEWNPQILYYIVVIICIIAGIIIGFFLYNSFLIIGTCILGGYLAMRGVIAIFGEYMDEGEFVDLIKSGEIEQMKEIRNGWTYAYLGLWLVLMVLGLFCQCKMYKKS
jgi:hypothetical protein